MVENHCAVDRGCQRVVRRSLIALLANELPTGVLLAVCFRSTDLATKPGGGTSLVTKKYWLARSWLATVLKFPGRLMGGSLYEFLVLDFLHYT